MIATPPSEAILVQLPVGHLAGPVLDIPWIGQGQSNWCWAACAQMTLSASVWPHVQQCDLANDLLKGYGWSCCPTDWRCDQPCYAIDVATVYAHWGFGCNAVHRPIDPAALKTEIVDNERPVEIGFQGPDNGHLVLAIGCDSSSGDTIITINDPACKQGSVHYDALRHYPDVGDWTWTWVRLEKSGNGAR